VKSEVGSGRNGHRPKLRRLLADPKVTTVVVEHRDRLVAMASRRGIAVAGVPAAYSSIWGRQHWMAPLLAQHQQVSRPTAAAVVLGRSASRAIRSAQTTGTSRGDHIRRIEAAGQPADVESYQVGMVGMAGTMCQGQSKHRRRQGNHTGGPRPETATDCLAEPRSGRTVGSRPGATYGHSVGTVEVASSAASAPSS